MITLLIIGVVASLTIPAIISETEKAETATQVKKYQGVLQQAVLSIKIEYGDILNSPLNTNANHSAGWNALKQYLNIVKDCETVTGQTCFANGIYRKLNATDSSDLNNYASVGRGILQDGASILYDAKTNCSINRSTTHTGPLHDSNCAAISIDVNGYKLPNTIGRDVFGWYIMKDGTVYPIGALDDEYRGCDPTSTDITPGGDGAPGSGGGCTAKVIKEGKIAY